MRAVALRFAGTHGVLFTIRRDPRRMTAADVSAYSAFPDEHEVLLLPSLRFRVEAIHQRGAFAEVILFEEESYPDGV